MMRSCARRSFDAATIFIAFVICCVFFTARTRRRRSISDGMYDSTCQSRRSRDHRGNPRVLVRSVVDRYAAAAFLAAKSPANSFTAVVQRRLQLDRRAASSRRCP